MENIPKQFQTETRLVKMQTSDGIFKINNKTADLEKTYYVNRASKRLCTFLDGTDLIYIEMIEVWDEKIKAVSLLPTELFDI